MKVHRPEGLCRGRSTARALQRCAALPALRTFYWETAASVSTRLLSASRRWEIRLSRVATVEMHPIEQSVQCALTQRLTPNVRGSNRGAPRRFQLAARVDH